MRLLGLEAFLLCCALAGGCRAGPAGDGDADVDGDGDADADADVDGDVDVDADGGPTGQECDYGHLWSGTECVAVPVLSVYLYESVDETLGPPSQRVAVDSLEPVRPEPVELAEVLAEDGACVIYEPFEGLSVLSTHESYCGDWGSIEAAGASLPFACGEDGHAWQSVDVGYAPASSVEVRGTGGAVFPAFEETIATPERLTVALDGSIEQGETFSVSWSGARPAAALSVTVTAIPDGGGGAVTIWCRPPFDATSVTIGPTLSSLLAASVYDWTVSVLATTGRELDWDEASAVLSLGAGTSTVLRAPL